MSISFIFLILAAVCFLGAAVKQLEPRVNLVGLGLFLYVLAGLIGR